MATLSIKLVPGARQNRIVGKYGDGIKVQVNAPPEQGKANDALVRLLSSALGIKPQHIRILRGHSQPRKVIEVEGMDEPTILARLESAGSGASGKS